MGDEETTRSVPSRILDHRDRDRDQDRRQVHTHDPYTYGYESALVLPQLNRGSPSVTKQFGLKKFAGIVVVVVVVHYPS